MELTAYKEPLEILIQTGNPDAIYIVVDVSGISFGSCMWR